MCIYVYMHMCIFYTETGNETFVVRISKFWQKKKINFQSLHSIMLLLARQAVFVARCQRHLRGLSVKGEYKSAKVAFDNVVGILSPVSTCTCCPFPICWHVSVLEGISFPSLSIRQSFAS